MSTNDRSYLLVIPIFVVLVAFWFMAIAPKKDDARKLESQITELQASVQKEEQAVEAGSAARKSFPRDYHRLVVLGKAVPVDDETASFLVQVQKIAETTGVSFLTINLSEGAAAAGAAAPVAAPATEGAASLLPIGSSVGAAGLPTLPYTMTFRGTYFQIADFMAGIDRLVNTKKNRIAADGRLVTVDGFDIGPDATAPFPVVMASLNVTTYVTPADQGLTGGATPTGPVTTTAPTTTPASSTTPAAP